MNVYYFGLALALSATLFGCGKSESTTFSRIHKEGEEAPGGAEGDARAKAAGPADQPVVRKIIYTSTIELIVENIETSEKDLRQLVGQEKGAYIAKAELRGSPGVPRSGSWTIRVTVEQFEAFRQALLKLGEVQRDSLDSQDVTEQFYDLDARIKNNKAREESLRKLLDRAGQNKIEDYLAVQQKLDQVTAELDVQKGQLQRLDKLSTLATVNITMQERKGYVRPEAPGFGSRLGRTFSGSMGAMWEFGQGVVIVAVAVAPWLTVFALFGTPLWWALRRRRAIAGAEIVETGIPAVETPVQTPPAQ